MATAPRDLSDKAAGLAPLKPPGPGTNVGPLRVDALALLTSRSRAIVETQADCIALAQAGGASDPTLHLMRGMLRRLIRSLYEDEVRNPPPGRQVDFDPTTGRATL